MNNSALFKKISRKVGSSIFEHQMLEPNDRVLIALSGGKDSYILLETLAERKPHLPFPVELFAMHVVIKEVGYNNDLNYMQQLCNDLKIPLYIEEGEVDLFQNPKKAPCFVCSWHRRKLIFNKTKELNCNKLAFGHHMDDALQTYMLNLIYHGSISSMPYKLSMFENRVQLIRPLLSLEEELLVQYANERQFPKELQKCPYDKETKRAEVNLILEKIYLSHRLAKINMFRSMGKICNEYLPKNIEKSDVME